ncbi:NAD-dependent epimerase/dehydratase family protein [Pseudomonas granadensis]|uniref:NAD-dependent epimerase/dehydratase family protein n=1 Tax=Pseudomonas granadensis TaxID=1421430 RepID=A0ABX7GL08_9PSED|nr:NAD-dependent epimerase/dehydratase family protein [Pseudomonas granadensis]MBN6774505.1 NAD-dependent epimerase/dehydratase family protein [Pseudomonas granadensis]MBN6805695.1 NAD-dependent epimerase/dehydratase family protein [Pseudomonas granadensis]MBN6832531.1 NAD-dependent epimerase/dehydratase family protein [Pseudomonas granadensis]MBN6839889.1 NAD-dependent epimerase/dehydratase family protein [Pseudomonas granadensis]MBN6869264.1 NAD-dependent epimerase/dehydratase family protein
MNVFITGAAGFIGGSIATGLVQAGHQVTGLVRSVEQADELKVLGITAVVGTLDDQTLLAERARTADAVINAASSDHRGAVEALLDALRGTNKVFLHTSGSSIVGDASGGQSSDVIYFEDNLPEPTVDKAARVAIDNLVLAAAKDGVNSAVICNTLIYGHSLGVKRDSVQLPRLLKQARKSGVVRHVGPGQNIWSNVHIEDVVALYVLALSKNVPGTFYFVESGEASFVDMTTAMAAALNLGQPQDWPLQDAEAEWGYEMANYGLGSNSRVRGKKARELLGWAPKRTSVVEWIRKEMV